MNIDITQIVTDKMTEMEDSGAIKARIEKNIEDAVTRAIDDALGGWSLRELISKELKKQLPDIVEKIGLDGYNAYIAETVRNLAVAAMREDAAKKMNAAIEGILTKKRESIRLSEILDEYRKDINYNEEDEKLGHNEEDDGYTCRVDESDSFSNYYHYYKIYLDEEGGKDDSRDPDDFETVVRICTDRRRDGTLTDGRIEEIYLRGAKVSRKFITGTPSSFEALLINLYQNRTPIIIDMENYDPEDHYYETEEP